jgi:hypothetical protein
MSFDFGDSIVFCASDRSGDKRAGSIVAIKPVETEEQARIFGQAKGTVLYTV